MITQGNTASDAVQRVDGDGWDYMTEWNKYETAELDRINGMAETARELGHVSPSPPPDIELLPNGAMKPKPKQT